MPLPLSCPNVNLVSKSCKIISLKKYSRHASQDVKNIFLCRVLYNLLANDYTIRIVEKCHGVKGEIFGRKQFTIIHDTLKFAEFLLGAATAKVH